MKYVLEAKQPETRAPRVAKTVETLAQVKPRTTVIKNVKKAVTAPTQKSTRR